MTKPCIAVVTIVLGVACGGAEPRARSEAETEEETETAPEWEGFFSVGEVTDMELTDRGIPLSVTTLRRVVPRIGKLIIPGGEREASEAELDTMAGRYCADPEVRAWNAQRCQGLDDRICDAEVCRYPHFGNCSGFFVDGTRFVTAAHCVHELADDAQIVRATEAGTPGVHLSPRAIAAGKHDFEHHWVVIEEGDPIDVAVIEVDDQHLPPWPVAPVPAEGAPVFLVGFPRAERRSEADRRRVGYSLVFGTPSVSFGRVVDVNESDAPLCNVDGRQEHWGLRAPCPVGEVTVDGEATWRGPILAHPILASYDTTNGYSGGPVFDGDGNLVAINSTLVGSSDPQERYGEDFRAVSTPAETALDRLTEALGAGR